MKTIRNISIMTDGINYTVVAKTGDSYADSVVVNLGEIKEQQAELYNLCVPENLMYLISKEFMEKVKCYPNFNEIKNAFEAAAFCVFTNNLNLDVGAFLPSIIDGTFDENVGLYTYFKHYKGIEQAL